ncbi:unnamed protein product [Coregonus sp. 'balchen']|nr:unnamed protein product [Coregonus sp. 'balchen']
MLRLVALVMVCTYTVVAAEEAENTSHRPPLHYSSLMLPQHHISYFLHNNKRVARLCREDPRCPLNSLEVAQELFWKQADFGYVRERLSEMKALCKVTNSGDSSLKCTSHTRFCRATNLYLDLRNPRRGHVRYKEDFLQEGEIGGRCSLNSRALAAEGEHKSPLQSW